MAYGDTAPVGTGIRNQPTTGSRRLPKGKGRPMPAESRTQRYKRLAKAPGTRASVPSQYLSPEQRRQREMNARLNQVVGPGSTVTNRDISRQASQDANVRYGGAEQELASQLGRSVITQQRVPGYMEAYRQQLQAAKAATQQAFAQAQQQMYSNAQQAGVGAAGVTDPGQQQIEAQAAAVRQQRASTLGDVASVQGANSAAGFNSQIANVGLRLVEELAKEAGNQNEIGRKKLQVASEKGQYRASRRQELGDAARKSGLENLVFASDQQQAAAKAKTDAAKFDFQRASTQADDARADSAAARQAAADRRAAEKDKYQREHGLGPYKPTKPSTTDKDEFGNTKKDRQRAQDAYTAALNVAGSLKATDWKTVRDYLIQKKRINPAYAQGAAMQAVLGYVGDKTAADLRKRGVQRGYKPKRTKTGKTIASSGSGYGGMG